MRMLALFSVLGAAVTLSACEPYAGPPGGTAAAAPAYAAPASAVAPACFRSYDIKNHTLADSHTIYLNVGNRSVYRVETSGACFAGATTTDPIITRSPPGSTYVCKPIDLDLSVAIGGGFPTHCIVSAITPLSPQEVAALPPKLRP